MVVHGHCLHPGIMISFFPPKADTKKYEKIHFLEEEKTPIRVFQSLSNKI
jgi:hypothetical protein